MQPAGEQEIIWFQRNELDPRLQRFSGCCSDLELHWSLCFVLHDDGPCGLLISVAYIAYLEGYKIASTQFAVDSEIEERKLSDTSLHLKAHS